MTSRKPGVLLDVDGTLVDNSYLHTLAWWRAFADAGERVPMNAIHRLIGMGGDQLVPRLLGRDDPEIRHRRSERYRELFGDLHAFAGAGDLMRRLHSSGLRTVLATSSNRDEFEAALSALNADGSVEAAVDAVATGDDADHTKPAPDILEAAISKGNIDPDRVLSVGDSVWDIGAADRSGIGCLGVETGGFSKQELSEAGALHVYRDVGQLSRQLFSSPLGNLRP